MTRSAPTGGSPDKLTASSSLAQSVCWPGQVKAYFDRDFAVRTASGRNGPEVCGIVIIVAHIDPSTHTLSMRSDYLINAERIHLIGYNHKHELGGCQ